MTARRTRVEAHIYRRPDGALEVGLRDVDGRQRWFRAGRRITDARRLRDELLGRRARGEPLRAPAAVRGAPTLGEAAELWLSEAQGHLSAWTVRRYREAARYLGPLLARRVGSIEPADLAAQIAAMRREVSDSTIRMALTVVRRSYRWVARRQGLVFTSPVDLLEATERPSQLPARERRRLNREELAALLEAAPEGRWRTLFEFAAVTGARLGEVLAVRWRDLDLDDRPRVRIEWQIDRDRVLRRPKTARSVRELPLPAGTARRLLVWRARTPWSQPDDFVFASENGTPLDRSNVRRAFDRALRAARFPDGRPAFPEALGARQGPKPTFHSLRHTAATLLLAEGAALTEASRHLGHATPNVTLAVYARELQSAEAERARRDLVERAFRGFTEPASMEALWKRYGSASASTGGNWRET